MKSGLLKATVKMKSFFGSAEKISLDTAGIRTNLRLADAILNSLK